MHNKKLLILAALAAVLIVVGLVTKQKPQVTMEDQAKMVSMAPADLKAADVTKIEITVPPPAEPEPAKTDDANQPDKEAAPLKIETKPLILAQKESEWLLPNTYGAPVDKTKIDDLIHALVNLEGEFRSEATEVLADYGLDPKSALTIRIYAQNQDEPALTLLVGKTADNKTHFVRHQDSDKVYVVDQDLRTKVGASGYDLNLPPDYKRFVDLNILTLEKPRIQKITLSSNLLEYRLEKSITEQPVIPEVTGQLDPNKPPEMKKVEKWDVHPGNISFNLQPGGAQRLMSKIERVAALSIIDEVNQETDEKYGFNSPEMILDVSLDNDREKKLFVGKRLSQGDKPGDQYAVKVSDLPNVYAVPASGLENLFIKQNDVFDLKLVKIEEADLTEVSISGPLGFDFIYNDEKKAWVMSEPVENEKINETRLKQIFQVLRPLEALGFATKVEPGPDRNLVLTEKKGAKYEFEVDPSARPLDTRLVKFSRAKQPILIQKNILDRLLPAKKDIIKQN